MHSFSFQKLLEKAIKEREKALGLPAEPFKYVDTWPKEIRYDGTVVVDSKNNILFKPARYEEPGDLKDEAYADLKAKTFPR
jgi:hypothetical protein